jgi:hypothetical protein
MKRDYSWALKCVAEKQQYLSDTSINVFSYSSPSLLTLHLRTYRFHTRQITLNLLFFCLRLLSLIFTTAYSLLPRTPPFEQSQSVISCWPAWCYFPETRCTPSLLRRHSTHLDTSFRLRFVSSREPEISSSVFTSYHVYFAWLVQSNQTVKPIVNATQYTIPRLTSKPFLRSFVHVQYTLRQLSSGSLNVTEFDGVLGPCGMTTGGRPRSRSPPPIHVITTPD